MYKVFGGYVRNVMFSNVICFGVYVCFLIFFWGIKYVNDVELGLIKDLFKSYGCYYCGRW